MRVCLRAGARVAFGDRPIEVADLSLAADIDRHNFERVPAGTTIGWLADPVAWPLEARGAAGDDCTRRLFGAADGVLCTRHSLTPIMMTTDATIAASDRLFYATWPAGAAGGVLDPAVDRGGGTVGM